MPDLVARPAQEGAVIQLGDRGVRDRWHGAGFRDVRGCDLLALGRIVERPTEVDVRRIGVDLARDVGLLLFRHSVNFRLIRRARRSNCKKKKKEANFFFLCSLRESKKHRKLLIQRFLENYFGKLLTGILFFLWSETESKSARIVNYVLPTKIITTNFIFCDTAKQTQIFAFLFFRLLCSTKKKLSNKDEWAGWHKKKNLPR